MDPSWAGAQPVLSVGVQDGGALRGQVGEAGGASLSHPGSALSDESDPSVTVVQEADFLPSHLMTLLDMMCRSER